MRKPHHDFFFQTKRQTSVAYYLRQALCVLAHILFVLMWFFCTHTFITPTCGTPLTLSRQSFNWTVIVVYAHLRTIEQVFTRKRNRKRKRNVNVNSTQSNRSLSLSQHTVSGSRKLTHERELRRMRDMISASLSTEFWISITIFKCQRTCLSIFRISLCLFDKSQMKTKR